jgi:3',5'-cyclic AMP phosphodiesterase CpdA
MSNNTLDAYTQLNQIYPTVRTRQHVAFIGLSSVFAAPWFRATGNVAEQQLERLQRILSSKVLNAYCKVLLIHHPLTLTHTPSRKCLLNRDRLIDLLKQYPVELVLHGHGHNTCFDSIQSNDNTEIPIIGMSSSSSTQQAHNYKAEFLLFDVSKNQSSWSIHKRNYTLDIKQKIFIPTTQQEFIMPFAI